MKRTKTNCIAVAKEIRKDMLYMAHMHKQQGKDIEYSKAMREVMGWIQSFSYLLTVIILTEC